jgi:hypothetical protein
MKKLIFPLLALCLFPAVSNAGILINEVHFNVPGPDDNFEFIELRSTTGGAESLAGLSLIIINNALHDNDGIAQNPGEILEVLNLGELSTGSNGLLLLGNGYTDSPLGGPWSGYRNPATATGDPAGLGSSDIQTNSGLTVLLIRNYNAAAGPKGTDIDQDVILGAKAISTGDGLIDWKDGTPPANPVPKLWEDADVLDGVGFQDTRDTRDAWEAGLGAIGWRRPYTTADLTAQYGNSTNDFNRRDPDTFARQLSNTTANAATAWYGGQLKDGSTLPTEVIYRTSRTFGPLNMVGQVTPGSPNLQATLPATQFRINEVGLNPSGSLSSDDRYQYVEILNVDGQARSLSGYWLILLDSYDGSGDANDISPGVGTILEEWNLSDFSTGPNGLLLLGDGYSPSYTPYQDAVSPQTAVGDPATRTSNPASSGWGLGDLRFKDGHTLLLVKGYTPLLVRDLDASPQDGVLDTAIPGIEDQIGFTQVAKTTIGRTYSAVNLRSVMNAASIPDNLSRKLGNLAHTPALNAQLAWYGGNYPGGSSPMTVGFENSTPANVADTFAATWFGGFRGAGTPGQPNLAAPINPVSPPLAASIRINEVMINPTNDLNLNTDGANEFIELASTNEGLAYLDGLWVLVVDLNGTVGNIQTGFPLNGYTTGTNGLVLLGDGYDNTNGSYIFNEGTLPPNTAAFDPPVGLEGNQIPNNGTAILLVRGIKGPITLNPGGRPIGDLDPENDGTLLLPAVYTDELLDSIVVNNTNPGPAYAWMDSTTFAPHHVARYPRNFTANTPVSWYAGQIPQGPLAAPVTNYTGSYTGLFQGAASPGRANHGATPGPTAIGDVVLNEIHFNPAGADNNFEYIELLATHGTARSLNGYSLLAIDNVISGVGAVRHAWSLDGTATGSNGLMIIGNRYTQPGQNPWSSVLRSQTTVAAPPGRDGLESSFSPSVLAGESDNQNLTLLLVRNFTRYIDYDLDDRTPILPSPPIPPNTDGSYDSPGDGVFDSYPWQGGAGGIHDSIMLRSYVPTVPAPFNPIAPYPWNGWVYGLPNLSSTFFPAPASLFYHVETIARFRGETTANDPNAWYGGDLTGGVSGNSGTAEDYITSTQDPTHPPRPAGFWGRVTPGQPNLIRDFSADPDGDGVPNLIEQAINTNPASGASAGPLPAPTTITNGGQTYLGLSYPRIRTGVLPLPVPYAAEAYNYILETSPDLTIWTPDPGTGAGALVPVGTPTANPDGVTETVTVRLPAPVTTAPGRQYIRLRINRR